MLGPACNTLLMPLQSVVLIFLHTLQSLPPAALMSFSTMQANGMSPGCCGAHAPPFCCWRSCSLGRAPCTLQALKATSMLWRRCWELALPLTKQTRCVPLTCLRGTNQTRCMLCREQGIPASVVPTLSCAVLHSINAPALPCLPLFPGSPAHLDQYNGLPVCLLWLACPMAGSYGPLASSYGPMAGSSGVGLSLWVSKISRQP